MHQQVVQERLSELAQILGYEHVALDTRINFSDMQILLEEVGTSSAPLRELLRFLREKQRGMTNEEVTLQEPEEEEDLEEWYRLQNTKDLLAAARRHGATVEAVPQGWLRVTTASGSLVHFKHIGKRDLTRGKRDHKEKPPTEKKEAIRACTEVEEDTVSTLFQQSEVVTSPQEAEMNEEFVAEEEEEEEFEEEEGVGDLEAGPAAMRRASGKPPRPDNIMRREDAGKRSRPRRRGPSEVGHVHGKRISSLSV